MTITVEHVLLFALVVYALYYLLNRCGCKEGMKDSGVQVNCADRITENIGADLVDEIDQCLFQDGDNKTKCQFNQSFWKNKCVDFPERKGDDLRCEQITEHIQGDAWNDLNDVERAKLCKKYTNLVKDNKDNVCLYDLANLDSSGLGKCMVYTNSKQ